MSCFCDYDHPEFYNSAVVVARKPHRCEECGGPIVTGEKYEYVSGKWAGEFGTFRTCHRCTDLRQWVTNNVPCVCWAHGNLMEDLFCTVQDAHERAREEVGGLLFGFYRRRERIYRRNKALAVAA